MNKLEKSLAVILGILVSLLIIAVFGSITAGIVWLAWNYTMPALFGLPKAGFLQIFALLVLVRVAVSLLKGKA